MMALGLRCRIPLMISARGFLGGMRYLTNLLHLVCNRTVRLCFDNGASPLGSECWPMSLVGYINTV
jgi:hypothetical protein